jgi:hypothetical protein
MAKLLQDIKTQSNLIIKAFAADKVNLDYSVQSQPACLLIQLSGKQCQITRLSSQNLGGSFGKNRFCIGKSPTVHIINRRS